jgi:hypothetical protein
MNAEHAAVDELPIAFSAFAATLRPQVSKRDSQGRPIGTVTAGKPDEIWLKFINKSHGREKHSPSEWQALIDSYRHQPAYKG